MANIALGKLPLEDKVWERAEEATNGNSEKYTGQDGFAHAKHPCTYTLDLGKSTSAYHIRFLLWDNLGTPEGTLDGRKYKYRLYTSTDAKRWEYVGESPKEGTISWQDFEFQIPQKLRFVRLECLAGTSVPKLHLVEFEVHDEKPDPIKTRGPINHRFVEDRFIGVRQKVDELVSEIMSSSGSIKEIHENSETWSKKIQELHTLLSAEEANIKELIEKNATALEQIQQINSRFEEASIKNAQAGELLKSLKSIEVEVKQTKEGLVAEEKSIKDISAGVQAYSKNTFEPLKNEVQNLRNNVAKNATDSNELVKQIQAALNDGKGLFDQIKSTLDQSGAKKTELDKTFSSIQALFEKATNPQDGIQATIDQVKNLKGQVDELAGSLKQKYQTASEQGGHIDRMKQEAQSASSIIEKAKTDSLDAEKKINEIWQIAVKKGMGSEFAEAVIHYDKQTKYWRNLVFGGTVVLLIVAIWFAVALLSKEETSQLTVWDVLLRFLTLSPIIYLLIFAARQYRRTMLLFEKYRFKIVLSFSFEPHTKQLISQFPDRKDDILEWTLDKLNTLYKEPYFDEAMKMKYKIELDRLRFGSDLPDDDAEQDHTS